MSSSASGSNSEVSARPGGSGSPAPTSKSQLPGLPRPPAPPPPVVRYLCTINQSCRQPFDNYNSWAQHETNAHRAIDAWYAQPKTNEVNVNRRMKPEEQASTSYKQMQHKSSICSRVIALQKADELASTYDIWYCDGVDGCLDGWYNMTDFETHFRERHAMGWNRLPRSTITSDYLLGPEHGVRFWCGFCNMVMEVSSKDKWHYDRLAHVASHFDRTCPDEIWYGNIYGWCFIEMH